MKNNKKAFTLVEVLVVISIIGIIMTIAIPGIYTANKRIKQDSLESKKDMIIKAAQIYVQDNSNTLKNSSECQTAFLTSTSCNIELKLDDLIKEGAYASEKSSEDDENVCDIVNPVDSSCLDCSTLKITLYQTRKKPEIQFEEPVDGTLTTCP